MLRFATIAGFAGLALVTASAASAQDVAALKAEAAAIVGGYGGKIKDALMSALEKGGPTAALDVCNKAAPAIADDVSRGSAWKVARTSLKPRNAASAPDDYERKIMEAFNARIAAGEKASDLASAEIVEQNGRKVFRFVKAIPTASMCLTCHGAAIAPDVANKISALYPADTATGFKAGDMRGVFTLRKAIAAQ